MPDVTTDPGESKSTCAPSALLVPAVAGIFAWLGTDVGAVLQGYWSLQLERQKFEAVLIQDALKTTVQEDAAKQLKFLVRTGLLEIYSKNIQAVAEKNPAQLPTSSPATSGSRAKRKLKLDCRC